MNNKPLVIERTFNAPADKVWKAITDKGVMKQMGFEVAAFKPVVGFEFTFEGGKDQTVFRHICVITEVVPEKKLTHSWRYDGYPGNSLVTYELFPEGGKTRLRLTHTGLETFEIIGPHFARENFIMGWTQIVGTILKDIVEKAE